MLHRNERVSRLLSRFTLLFLVAKTADPAQSGPGTTGKAAPGSAASAQSGPGTVGKAELVGRDGGHRRGWVDSVGRVVDWIERLVGI